jgi:regulator of protease activity HflC (stomatin/prohibitin superfamily)
MFNVRNVNDAIIERASTAIRSVVSSLEVDELLHNNDIVRTKIIESIGNVDDWGIEVTNINIKDIKFDDSMMKSMATRAEADRLAQAKIINANADIEVAKKFKEASEIYKGNDAMKLREMQLLSTISKNHNTTIYFYPTSIGDFLLNNKK